MTNINPLPILRSASLTIKELAIQNQFTKTMTTLIHCYKHNRGYFDFVSSTLTLAELYPQYDVTWAIPSTRVLSSVLSMPQSELYRDHLDCTFHSLHARGYNANRRGFNEFDFQLRQLGVSQSHVYCDFRYGCERRTHEKYKAMLTFKPEIAAETLKTIRSQFGKDYSVLHVRTGDAELRHGKTIELDQWIKAIQNYRSRTTGIIVFISDSISLKHQMSGQILSTPGSPYHSGDEEGDVHSFVFDVLTIQNAKSIHSMMANAWGRSSFSRVPAKFAGIPTTQENIC